MQTQYQGTYGHDYQQAYAYDSGSLSSSPTGGYPMSADYSSQSMSSTSSHGEPPSPWLWNGQEWIISPSYTTVPAMSSQIYHNQQDPHTYTQQIQYQQPQQQSHKHPRTQRVTEKSPSKENKYSPPLSLSHTTTPLTDHPPQNRQYICLEPGCSSTAQHTRAADLARHQRTVHRITERFDCPRTRCTRKGERAFSRSDHLLEHLRSYHGEDIPKGEKRGSRH